MKSNWWIICKNQAADNISIVDYTMIENISMIEN